MVFSGLALYVGSSANFLIEILGLPETAFAWIFIPLVGGMVAGSAWGGKRATKAPPGRLSWVDYRVMAVASILNVGYNALFEASVPWAVLPLAVFTFGLAVAMPGSQLSAMDLFPNNRAWRPRWSASSR